MSPTTHAPPPPPSRRSWWTRNWLIRRWPTAFAVAFGALNWGIDPATAAQLLPLLPLVYIAMTAVQQRRLTWPVLVISFAAVAALNVQPAIDPTLAVTLLAAVLALTGLVRASAHTRKQMVIQTVAFAALAAITVAGLSTDPGRGHYLLAAGWLAHAGWDVVHHRQDRVVSRSYSEWCGVFDLIIAASLIAS